MPTNQPLPAIVCLSMIVSGCTNQDLFNNWTNADKPESVYPDMQPTAMTTADMAACMGPCPCPLRDVWSENFSEGLFLRSDPSSFSVWKTSAATWILEHFADPSVISVTAPPFSWSLCDRSSDSAWCQSQPPMTAMPPDAKLSFISFGGKLRPSSAAAYFPKEIQLSNISIDLSPKINPGCNTTPNCNLAEQPYTDLIITIIPSNIVIKHFRCSSKNCDPVPTNPIAPTTKVKGIRITYSSTRTDTPVSFDYLNFTVNKLTLCGNRDNPGMAGN